MPDFKINTHTIGEKHPTYFIADISANHDGQLERAKLLMRLAKEAGADAAKFQHFRAEHIVSDHGFRSLGKQLSHQAQWSKPVFEVYQAASLPWEWTPELKAYGDKIGIDFFTAPYDFEAVDHVDPYVPAYKVGSGDVTWTEILAKMASKKKPIILATGASSQEDVDRAIEVLRKHKVPIGLMQCNTNYTGSLENFDHIHLNVLRTYKTRYPDVVLGLSDHTPGSSTVLGAVALGARLVEKHFTDDTHREGPDHPFSMDPKTWEEMVRLTRQLERALGQPEKKVAANEQDTVVVQRRCVRALTALPAGTVLKKEHLTVLRPAPRDGIFPYEMDKMIGRKLRVPLEKGEYCRWDMLEK